MSQPNNSELKRSLEDATRLPEGTEKLRFNMINLMSSIFEADPSIKESYRQLENLSSINTAKLIFQGIIRNAFLIEYVRTKGGATRMGVRWNDDLKQSNRHATFEECLIIFENLISEASAALGDPDRKIILEEFAKYPRIPYELPIDYTDPSAKNIHTSANIEWILDDKIGKVSKMRHALLNKSNSDFKLWKDIYSKVDVKCFLTDRAQTGDHQTNREKRWEAYPTSPQFATRRECLLMEYSLINQIVHFEGFPEDLYATLRDNGALEVIERPFKCPIVHRIFKFDDFKESILNPEHGRSGYQVGHINPLKAGGLHSHDNISWITSDGNRIQGDLSLDQVKNLFKEIFKNRPDLKE